MGVPPRKICGGKASNINGCPAPRCVLCTCCKHLRQQDVHNSLILLVLGRVLADGHAVGLVAVGIGLEGDVAEEVTLFKLIVGPKKQINGLKFKKLIYPHSLQVLNYLRVFLLMLQLFEMGLVFFYPPLEISTLLFLLRDWFALLDSRLHLLFVVAAVAEGSSFLGTHQFVPLVLFSILAFVHSCVGIRIEFMHDWLVWRRRVILICREALELVDGLNAFP